MIRTMKLGEWLKGDVDAIPPRPKVTQAEFARRINSSVTLITGYLDGSVWPGRERMEAIVRETDGAVTANDFLSPETVNRIDAQAGAEVEASR